MTNPLLTSFPPPPFSAIKPDHVVPAATQPMADSRAAVDGFVAHCA
ncbi:hypothetical protein, partial [Salmonella enterica]